MKDALFPLLERVLTDVINDAMDGCNIADLISTGACFRSIINAMTSFCLWLPIPIPSFTTQGQHG